MQPTKAVIAVAAALAVIAPPAFAQYQGPYQGQYPSPTPYSDPRPTPQHQSDQSRYQADRAAYEQSRQDYEAARARWERSREQYDRQYGYGAYARSYGQAPAQNDLGYQGAGGYPSGESRADFDRRMAAYDSARAAYDRRWGSGAYERAYGPPPVWSADAYAQDASTTAYISNDPSCTNSKTNRSIGGAVIGALLGSALGSNVAGRGVRTEGAVLGALVGGGIGLGVGRASAKCDERGYYYSYDQTIPYQESDYDRSRRSGQYGYSDYDRMQCRLAPAQVSSSEQRYVRVCPDGQGRYRITG
ncbi:hypothetical protein [Phenylobacterium sp.]|uniref:hypothetical protein n=1 Tax=Phenylobacterium sp. TaxID=1871053 RepID=UPI00289985DF|nr:hypothetical protein [Phenylobacterium sp.]